MLETRARRQDGCVVFRRKYEAVGPKDLRDLNDLNNPKKIEAMVGTNRTPLFYEDPSNPGKYCVLLLTDVSKEWAVNGVPDSLNEVDSLDLDDIPSEWKLTVINNVTDKVVVREAEGGAEFPTTVTLLTDLTAPQARGALGKLKSVYSGSR